MIIAQHDMNKANNPTEGEIRHIDGEDRIYYFGYWVRYYEPPKNTIRARRQLIQELTRRVFHHTEAGINTPGERLEEARKAVELEKDPARRRVNEAMLAGALFNRATDIFASLVNLSESGVEVSVDNELMVACGNCLEEALELGKQVKHISGEEGIDELWGEPFKAFTQPIEKFYESRFIKVAQTMAAIDQIAQFLIQSFEKKTAWAGLDERVLRYAKIAKAESEIMKRDPKFLSVWPEFVAAGEAVDEFMPVYGRPTRRDIEIEPDLLRLIRRGRLLISYLAGARVPMPKSQREFQEYGEGVLGRYS